MTCERVLFQYYTSLSLEFACYSCTFFLFFPGITCAPGASIYDDQAKNQWFKDGVDLTKMNIALEPNTKPAKNVILFLGKFASYQWQDMILTAALRRTVWNSSFC